jgi:hypothetical protein
MKELYLYMLVKYMLSFLSTKNILLHNIIFHWEIRAKNGKFSEICTLDFFYLFCVFQIEFTLCCHNFILNDIHDLMTFITNKQNTKRIWV